MMMMGGNDDVKKIETGGQEVRVKDTRDTAPRDAGVLCHRKLIVVEDSEFHHRYHHRYRASLQVIILSSFCLIIIS